MSYSKYAFLYAILSGIIFAEAPAKVENPSQCILLCKADSCKNNPSLADSCRTVCKKMTSYKKILQVCGNDTAQEEAASAKPSPSPEETPSVPTSYKEQKEKEKKEEFASALSRSRGRRLANIEVEEVKGLSKQGGLIGGSSRLVSASSKLSSKGIFMVLQQVNVIPSEKDVDDADKALKIHKGETGFYSDQLYIVTVEPAYLKNPDLAVTYVIKGLKSDLSSVVDIKENTPQKELQNLKKVKDFIVPQLQGTNVKISTDGGACWYFDNFDEKRYVVVLSVASGKSLDDWGDQYLNGSIEEPQWNHIMKSVGATIGSVHYTLATSQTKSDLEKDIVDWETFKTTIHDDFHGGNIFSDGQDQTTLIDAASMADSLNDPDKRSPLKDIADLYFQAKYMRYLNNPKGLTWLNDGFDAFIDGYVSAFPLASQDAVRKAVRTKYQEWSKGILDNIEKNGYAAYSGPDDVLAQVLPEVIAKFKRDKLRPAQVVSILKADEMARR